MEPKIRSCAWDLEYQDIDFFVIDVDEVDDVELLPENVCSLPSFLLYSGGELKECVGVVSQKRPGRVLSQAIRRVYDQSR